jgi:hypothetical protein
LDMDMLFGHGHAAWTWTCCLDMGMLLGHGHIMLVHGHNACTWT